MISSCKCHVGSEVRSRDDCTVKGDEVLRSLKNRTHFTFVAPSPLSHATGQCIHATNWWDGYYRLMTIDNEVGHSLDCLLSPFFLSDWMGLPLLCWTFISYHYALAIIYDSLNLLASKMVWRAGSYIRASLSGFCSSRCMDFTQPSSNRRAWVSVEFYTWPPPWFLFLLLIRLGVGPLDLLHVLWGSVTPVLVYAYLKLGP